MDYRIKLKHINESCEIEKLNDDAQGFVAALLCENFAAQDVVFVAENDAQMEVIAQQLRFFAPALEEKFEIVNFLAWDCLPFDRASPKQAIAGSRIKALYNLAQKNFAKNGAVQNSSAKNSDEKNNLQLKNSEQNISSAQNSSAKNFLVITSINAVAQKIIPPSLVKNSGLFVKAKSKISIAQITEFLIFNGYSRQASANDAGEFAVRGGIVDIVMNYASNLVGYRIDFFGEEVESIKEFEPLTQLSQGLVRGIEILPASEVILNEQTCANFREKYRKNFGQNFSLNDDDQLYSSVSEGRSYSGMEHWLPLFYNEELVSVFDYLKQPVIFLNQRIFAQAEQRWEMVLEYYKSRVESLRESKISGTIYNPLVPELLYFSSDEIKNLLAKNTHIIFNNFSSANAGARLLDLEISAVPNFALAGRTNARDPLELLQEFLNERAPAKSRVKVLIACVAESSQERLKKLLLEFNLKIETCLLQVAEGFAASDFILIGEQAIFGEKIVRKKSSGKAAVERLLEEGISINVGDLIVHRDHGIGRFDGIHTINLSAGNVVELDSRVRGNDNGGGNSISSTATASAVKTDMLKIIYGGSDTLFVPVEDINLITRYGADNPLIQLDRLGVAAWKNRKAKVRNRIKVAAEELIKIAAARHVKQAPVYVAEPHLYDEFKARFGFVETDDQLKAIDEIEDDLQKGSPMDRLVCGDVGFGKTEVAMRAAFIVCSGASKISASAEKTQVAIITPTTLLCRQHFHNFTKRFEGTGLKIKQLSRLVTAAEAKKIKQELEAGSVDIVIGTHALLNKNIKFKNLGLVIVDEEQHFGVAQKERLKELRHEVHILTLSATPIPRTLQMSLTGVKELSLIATPPLDRLAVRNFVMPYDGVIVREAIMREYQRSGKVFFVVPRVSDISEMERRLKKLLPEEIKITHAHGQMTPAQLDEIMNNFYDGKIDVLLSTTIIESGIDIASANTIIIYKAEMFGLAQLYQLRGRVGRGKVRGYAYFMLNVGKPSKDAKKKLEVMQNLDSLGVGFTIASHDMDIRGSGDILGDEQSGHIRETGVELYQQMLVEEIARVKSEQLWNNSQLAKKLAAVENGSGQGLGQDSRLRGNDSELENDKCKMSFPQKRESNASAAENNINNTTTEEDFTPQIKLGISLLIEESYIADLGLRMSFYKKIALVKNREQQENLLAEMTDRFGKAPQEVANLTEVSLLKQQCKNLAIEKLEMQKDGVVISFKNNKFHNPEALLQMVFASKGKVKLLANQKLLFVENSANPAASAAVKHATNSSNAATKIAAAFAVVEKLLAV